MIKGKVIVGFSCSVFLAGLVDVCGLMLVKPSLERQDRRSVHSADRSGRFINRKNFDRREQNKDAPFRFSSSRAMSVRNAEGIYGLGNNGFQM